MFTSDEDISDEDDFYSEDEVRPTNKRHRVHMTCNWEYLDPINNEHCRYTEYARGYCKHHFYKVFRRTPRYCIGCQEVEVDHYGDKYCTSCGSKYGSRRLCIECNKQTHSKNKEYCPEHDQTIKCRVEGCNFNRCHEGYGHYYCVLHHPDRRVCQHRMNRCKGYWFSKVKDHGDNGLCWRHGKGEESKRLNGLMRPRYPFKGRCSAHNAAVCKRYVAEGKKYCKYHSI